MTPLISVVVCTWNRRALLEGALTALVDQQDAPPHEVLVVDNASPDDSAALIQRIACRHPQVRHIYEGRQGLAFARNAAVSAARGSILAFTDDDVRVGKQWVARVAEANARWPAAACIGGPVLPEWPGPAPAWLTPRQWAPLGIQDYGAAPFRVDAGRPVCLIGANLALRRSALEAIGGFNPAVQRVGASGGSTEDHELHVRLWRAGFHGMYAPDVGVAAVVLPARLRKAHHRAWHYGHGRHVARMRLPEMEATRTGRLFDVPAHLLRQAAADACGCAVSLASGDTAGAFEREANLWFVAGFIRERWT
jgi:glycosyltransferase involved in cell wall biosynthesis